MGDDVLSSGPEGPPRIPRVALVLAALLALVAGVQGLRQLGGDEERAAPADRTTAEPTTPAAEPAATGPVQMKVLTRLRVLAGGEDLQTVQVDTGAVVGLDDSAWRHGGRVLALLGRPAGHVVVVRTDADRAWLLPRQGRPVLLGLASAAAPVGTDEVALVTPGPSAVTARRLRLSPVAAVGGPVSLPPGTTVVAGSGQLLVTEERAGGTSVLQVRDAGTGARVRTLAEPGHALTSDGRRLAWLRPGCDDQCLVRIADLTSGVDEAIAILDGERIGAAAFAPDGRLALAGVIRLAYSDDREPALIVCGPAPVVIRADPLTTLPTAAAWSPDGRWAFLVEPIQGGMLAWNRDEATMHQVAVRPGRLRGVSFLVASEG